METQKEIDTIKLRKLIFQPKDKLDELFVIRLNEIKEVFNDLGYFYKIFIENPEDILKAKIKRLIQEKILLKIKVDQLKDELNIISTSTFKEKCGYCLNVIDFTREGFSCGGNKKRLFNWCSQKCYDNFYKELGELNNRRIKRW